MHRLHRWRIYRIGYIPGPIHDADESVERRDVEDVEDPTLTGGLNETERLIYIRTRITPPTQPINV